MTAPALGGKSSCSQVLQGAGKRLPAVAGLIPPACEFTQSERAGVSRDPHGRIYRRGPLFAAPSARGLDCKCRRAPAERWFGFRAAVVISVAAA